MPGPFLTQHLHLQAFGRQSAMYDAPVLPPVPLVHTPLAAAPRVPAPLPPVPLVPSASTPLVAATLAPVPQSPAVAVDDAPVEGMPSLAYEDLPTFGSTFTFWAAPSAPSTPPVAAGPTPREDLVFVDFASLPSALLPVEGPMDEAASTTAADVPAVAAAPPAVALPVVAAAPAVALSLPTPAPVVALSLPTPAPVAAAVAVPAPVKAPAALPATVEVPAAGEVAHVPWAIPAGRASTSLVEASTQQVSNKLTYLQLDALYCICDSCCGTCEACCCSSWHV